MKRRRINDPPYDALPKTDGVKLVAATSWLPPVLGRGFLF
jgi:hypothetical protein